ncbi:MAG: DUF2188 domain-containing protein [Victivallales bacterium]|nr:DUF2188 domain-containing protein [Victivallales bacterium]
MSDRNNHWISQREDGTWADKREGAKRASGLYNTQKEAFDAAREKAKQEGGEVIIKNQKGEIREKNTYGKDDPRESKG